MNDTDPSNSTAAQRRRSDNRLLGRLGRVRGVDAVVFLVKESYRFVTGWSRDRHREVPPAGPVPTAVAPSAPSHWDHRGASDRYDLEVIPTPRWKVPVAALVATVVSVASETSYTFGRGSAIVVDRSSGDVTRFTEPFITTDNTDFSRMIRSHHDDSADDFAARWLDGTEGSTRRR